MPAKAYHGSCACGALAYEVMIDLAAGTSRCNCTSCRKARLWEAFVKPEAFRMTRGEDSARRYSSGPDTPAQVVFCPACGIRTHTTGDLPQLGGAFVGVMLGTLDDATPDELAATPVTYMDGLHDNWANPPPVTSYL